MNSTSRFARNPLALAVTLAFAAAGAQAATITVNTSGDPDASTSTGTCSLRQAIQSADADSSFGNCTAGEAGADTINFDSSLANSTITLQHGQLVINAPVTIDGSGQTVDANQASRVMVVYYNSSTLTDVTLSSLTLTNGFAGTTGPGGGICASISNGFCTPAIAARPSRGSGPAIKAPQAAYAIYLTLNNVTVSNNTANIKGGGIVAYATSLTLNDSTVSNNSMAAAQSYAGGGIYSAGYGYLSLNSSTVSGNSASGGYDVLTGGIYSYASGVGITNSTLSGNTASCRFACTGGLSATGGEGAAIANLLDSTVSGNSAVDVSQGINSVGGVLIGLYGSVSLNLTNTILSANSGDYANDLFAGSNGSAAASASLLGTSLSSGFTGNGNLFSDAPGLGPLQNNGGPTMTRALLTGSPAIDAGNNSLVPGGLNYDQRGAGYSRIINTTVDIGAYEVQAAPAPAPAPTPTPTLSTWAMGLLGGLLALFGIARERRRRPRRI